MIVGASFDAPEANRLFKEKFDFPYDLVSDVDKSVAIAYGVVDDAGAATSPRTSFLIDPDGNIAKVYKPVVPAEHTEQVLSDLP